MANSSSVISDLPPPPGFLLDDLNSSKVVCNRQTSIRDTVTDFIDTVIERSSSLVEERRSGSLSNLAEEFAEKCYTDTPLKRHPYIVKDRNPFECVADIDENQFQPLTAEFFKKPLVESKRGSSPTSVSSYQTPQESPSSLEGNESSYHTCNTSAEIPSSSSELEQTLVEGNTLDANLTLQASSSSESLCNNNHSCESASMSDDESIPLPKPKIDYANLDFDSIEDPFGSSSKSMGFSPPKTSFLNETLSNKENLSSDPPKVKPVPPKRTVSKITKSAKPKPPVRKTFTSLSQPVSQQKGETLNGNEPKNLLQSGEVEMTKNKVSTENASNEDPPPPMDDPFVTKSKMSYSPPPPSPPPPPMDIDPFASKSKMSYSPPPPSPPPPIHIDPFATKSKMSYSPAPSPPPPIDVDPFATKSKMSYSPPLNAADPFETKSKMSYSPPPNVVDPFATKSKMSYSPPPSDVDPFATKSKMSYSPPPSVNCTPQSNNVSQNFQNGENVVNESKDFVDEAISDESENTNSFSSRKSFSTNTYRKPKKKRSPKSSEKDDSNSSFCEINISDTSSTNVDAVNTEEEYFNPNGLEELSKRGNLTDRSAEVLYGNKKNVEKLHIDGNNVQQSSQFSTLNEDNQSLRIANQMLKEENTTLAEDVEKLKVNLKLYAALIEQLKSQKENKIQEESQEKMKLIKEKEMAIEDIRSVERAFSEQHARYEKLKSVCESQQDECTSFRKYADEMKSLYEKELRRYEGLKEHANIKLNSANEEREKMKKQHDQEVTKLQTISKRLEMRNANLEQQIEQIKSENEELTQICDSLLAPSQAD